MRKTLKLLRNTILILLGLVVLAIGLINLTPVQNKLADIAAKNLSKRLNTTVRIGSVRIDFF